MLKAYTNFFPRQYPDTELPPNWLSLIDRGQRNESYMVWFRVAAFPNFRKLLGRIEGDTVAAGNYSLNIVYSILYTIIMHTFSCIYLIVQSFMYMNMYFQNHVLYIYMYMYM